MTFSVLLCLLLTILIELCQAQSAEVSSYECGRHGKFEYCIDGIPGCVIGCHCHPGYYFDTETKVCEPNTKLKEDFRRMYMAGATQVYPSNTPTLIQNTPTQTTVNIIDEKVDEISKDPDDIGEWLYNQFFKTIETQVINNASDNQPLTRRSSNDIIQTEKKEKDGDRKDSRRGRKIKRKARKSAKGKGKKGKSKVHGLRRKLLRITEDDSLFDSESGSDSSDDSSGSRSSSESSSSEVSSKERKDRDDTDHGHKKVVIFNRRPRPPLPSFIFLPNMDTPYYPPIGLPPPPILPMYPMVPVPPMAPFLPFLDNQHNSSPATTMGVAEKKPNGLTVTTATNGIVTESVAEPVTAETITSTIEEPETFRSSRHDKMKRMKMPPFMESPTDEQFLLRATDLEPRIPLTAKQLKLMHKLKKRLKMKQTDEPELDNNADDLPENISLYEDSPFLSNHRIKHKNPKKTDPKLKDVNFKYLSELIHRAQISSTIAPSSNNNSEIKQLETLPHSRRIYEQEIPSIRYEDEVTIPRKEVVKSKDDVYFMNLGRQIASLIREDESKIKNNIDTETTTNSNLQASIHAILNKNSYSPRSYWDRYVRSPLASLKNYLSELPIYKRSNENLFSLENEVNIFASTESPLSLQDIENMLTAVEKAHTKIKRNNESIKPSFASFNVNLLPNQPNRVENAFRRMYSKPIQSEYSPRKIRLENETNANVTHYSGPRNSNLPIIDNWAFKSKITPTLKLNANLQYLNKSKSKTLKYENSSLKPKPIFTNNNLNKNWSKKSQDEYLTFLKRIPVIIHNIANKPEPTARYPIIVGKQPRLYAMYPGPSVKYSELSSKSFKEPRKFAHTSAKLGDEPQHYPKQANRPEDLTKYQESLTDKTKSPTNYKPTLMNYKSLHYFTDNNGRYMFEASYPVDITNLKTTLSKRVETNKPSYFHHEFQHLDYFD